MIAESTTERNDTPLQIRTIGKGWFWIDNAVYDRYAPQIGIEGLGLYAAFARYANNKTAQCWPSLQTLAKHLGCDVALLETGLARLQTAGLVSITHDARRGTVITLLTPPEMQTPAVTAPPLASLSAPVAVPSPVCSSPSQPQPEQETQQYINKTKFFSQSSSSEKQHEQTLAPDKSWEKQAVPPPISLRPDEILDAAHLSPPAYTALYAEAEAALIAEGVPEFCRRTFAIESRMTVILERRQADQAEGGCDHPRVEEGWCRVCGVELPVTMQVG